MEKRICQPERSKHIAWTNAKRRGHSRGKHGDSTVTPGSPTKSDLIGRPIFIGRRQRPDNQLDSRGQANQRTQERIRKASKNSERHRKTDRTRSNRETPRTRPNRNQTHDVADKVLSQLNLFNQAITEYVKATVQGSLAAPKGSSQ